MIRKFLFLFCLTMPVALHAEPLTLRQAIDLAMQHAPAMKAAEAGRDASAEDAALGRAWLLPYVEATGSLSRKREKTTFDMAPAIPLKTNLNYNASHIGLKVVQSLFDLERWAGYRQGELSAQSGDLKLELEKQRLMLETARALLDVGTAQAALNTARAREEAAGKLAAQAEAAYRVGTSAKTDRLDAEARHDQAIAERLQAENDLDQAKAMLASLTGQTVDSVASPHLSDDPAAPKPDDPQAWEDKASEHAIAVKLAELQFDVARQGERKALGGALPKVEAFAEISRDRAGDSMFASGTTLHDSAVGLQVKVPLYAGGGTWAQVRKSEKESLQAQFSLDDDRRLARLTARQAFLSLRAAGAQVVAARKAENSTEQAAHAAHLGHQVGLRTVTEVLDADERHFAAQLGAVRASAQYVFASLQLQASVGELVGSPLPATFGENP